MKFNHQTYFLVGLVFIYNYSAQAESPAEKGARIAQENKVANTGFIGESSSMKMTLYDAHGASTERVMDGKSMEVEGDGDKSLSVFQKPLDVQNTKMLTWTHKNDDDDQWLYLPSMKRWKRISSSNKSSSFMGSEFSYEDLGSQEPEKFNYTYVKDDNLKEGANTYKTWVLERKPKKECGCSRQVVWIIQDKRNPAKIEYYDRKNELLKVAIFSQFDSFTVKGKKIWRPKFIEMKNVQTKKRSTIEWTSRELGKTFKERDFNSAHI